MSFSFDISFYLFFLLFTLQNVQFSGKNGDFIKNEKKSVYFIRERLYIIMIIYVFIYTINRRGPTVILTMTKVLNLIGFGVEQSQCLFRIQYESDAYARTHITTYGFRF